MDGEIIVRGKREGKASNHKKMIVITAIIAAVIMLFGIIGSIGDAGEAIEKHRHTKYCYKYSYRDDFYKDNKNDNLQSFKMDCDYTSGAFGLGMKRYFEGGFMFPFLILAVGITVALVKRARSRSYEITVTREQIDILYENGKTLNIPICSVFTLERIGDANLSIITSENALTLKDLGGRDEVYTAIHDLMPKIEIKGPANNEQVLAKGYPNAIKPWLLVLTIILVIADVIIAISAEEFAAFLVFLIPAIIVFVFYLLAKTPYLVVTDKRVFYVSDFGRKLSLPMNKITVTVTHWWFKQLHIAAPAGRIHLFGVRNTAELYDMISALLNEKQ